LCWRRRMNKQAIVTARVEGELQARLLAHASATGVSVSTAVRVLLESALRTAEK
jgi:antitoxin component of RelBE/YafQ-DinJ toxin-antitoxin module